MSKVVILREHAAPVELRQITFIVDHSVTMKAARSQVAAFLTWPIKRRSGDSPLFGYTVAEEKRFMGNAGSIRVVQARVRRPSNARVLSCR